ncbi:MAG TPA: glycogen debranching N-terminal domain-containing protein [Acidimicrobiales bacterium]|nr:glycogen debranching N-terminal domain-containing protein [Acidimicrobiales bacterium]
MVDAWNFTGESVALGQHEAIVTLVQGSAFCISTRSGDMFAGAPHGLFFRDSRFLSRFEVRVNGQRPEALAASTPDPFSAVFVSRPRPHPGKSDSTLLVFRHRWIGRGMREDLLIRNFADEPSFCSVELVLEADFAHLFEVKEGRAGVDPDRELDVHGEDGALVFRVRKGTFRRGSRLSFSKPAQVSPGRAVFEVIVPAQSEWGVCIQLTPLIDGEPIDPRYRCGEPVVKAAPMERMTRWRRQMPAVDTDHAGLRRAVAQSSEDLGALRIFDPDFPERTVVAAGAPWFMTLFGRDSILTAWMALLVDPELALGVLQTLARFQGTKADPRTDEEPGKILHEMRFGEAASLSLGGGHVYYGTADATPLFVMLLGEMRRWGLAGEIVDQLMPHCDRAMEWIERYGDRDGDGYVEYKRGSDRGLANQGWKDSWDGIRFADGDVARPPIALCEVQGYVYGAYLARAHFAHEQGDTEVAERFRHKAAALKQRFNEDFWLEDRGWYAVALDGRKRQVDSLASNMGHCLWTGIVDEDKAERVADHLLSPAMFSGWGIRTLASTMGGYNPISYHCGSVWPHDNAVIAAGLMRYGFVEHAQRVIVAMLDAAESAGGRLPELFTGLDRSEFPGVVGYPTSCSPQAWAAASPLLFLRTLLRLDPWVPHGKIWLAPTLPVQIGRLRVDRIPVGGGRVSVHVDDTNVKVEGLPPEVELITEPRRPLTAPD